MGDAYARLAALIARKSNWAETRRLAERALALEPENCIAQLALADADIGEKNFESAERRIRLFLSSGHETTHQRIYALYLLGDALDRQDRIADAFAAYSNANAYLYNEYAPKMTQPGVETGLALIKRLIAHFENAPVWPKPQTLPPRAPDDTSAALAFLMGFMRSGTTLLGQILASNPGIVTLEEKPVLADAARDFIYGPGLQRLPSLTAPEIARYNRVYWKHVRNLGVDVRDKVVIDKMPMNTICLPAIAKFFPQAKIIMALRDPRDVVFSCFRRPLTVTRFSFDFLSLEQTALCYDASMRAVDIFRHKMPLEVHEIRNEDVIADFDYRIASLCRFLQVEWTPAMKSFAKDSRKRAIATPSAQQVARGINSEGVAQWRRYAKQLEPILPILDPWVRRYGYASE